MELYIRMNDTPQGDGNWYIYIVIIVFYCIRMNDTPQGDGNKLLKTSIALSFPIRMNDTPQGDGNFEKWELFYAANDLKLNKNE